MSNILKAIIMGSASGLLALCWIAHSQTWNMPYTNFVYQEFSAESPKDGFEYVVGYVGDQAFYWKEIVKSHSFKMSVLEEKGTPAESAWGVLTTTDAYRYIPWDGDKRNSLDLVLSWTLSTESFPEINSELKEEMGVFGRAFVEEVGKRGLSIAPIGEVMIHSEDHGSLFFVLERWVTEVFLLTIFTAVATALFLRKSNSNRVAESVNSLGPHSTQRAGPH